MGIYDELSKLEERSPTPLGAGETVEQTEVTSKVTRKAARASEPSRGKSRETAREKPRALPTRDEVQEFSFRLRDELKVKVQAEVPHAWQAELEALARALNVRKLELYRFILGEFLGKVKRRAPD
jgi:hypothetical protein